MSGILHHQRGEAEAAGPKMKVGSFETLPSPPSSALEDEPLPLPAVLINHQEEGRGSGICHGGLGNMHTGGFLRLVKQISSSEAG